MKKLFLTSLTIFGLTLAAQAQDQVTLNVRLHPIQTIQVNSSQKIVDLNYQTINDYATGVSLEQPDHLTVYSTGGFAVSVQTTTDILESAHAEVTENISVSDIKLTPTLGTSQLAGTILNTVNLSTTPATLFSNTTGGVNRTFNVEYEAAGANAYVNKYFNVEDPTVYTTTVIYTIEAQ